MFRSILGMLTFRGSCNPFHQGEEHSDIELFFWVSRSFYITLLVEVVGRRRELWIEEVEEIDRSSITGRMVFHILGV